MADVGKATRSLFGDRGDWGFLPDAAKKMVEALKAKKGPEPASLMATEVLERQREEKRRIQGRYGLASTFLGGPRGIGGPASDVARTLLEAAVAHGDPWAGAAPTRVTPRAAPPPSQETLDDAADNEGRPAPAPTTSGRVPYTPGSILTRLRRR